MEYLTWITDERLEQAVEKLINVTKLADDLADKNLHKNVIDPFSAIFQIGALNMSYEDWIVSEKGRQTQKTMQNHVGSFHQSILGSVQGWTDMAVGQEFDLECQSKKIIAEVKNKHNTLTGGKLADQYKVFEKLVTPKASRYKGFTAYFVNVIPKRPQRFDIPFQPSDKGKGMKCPENELIRYIDGSSFYELVTGVGNALEQLFGVLPRVINKISRIELSDPDCRKLKELFYTAYGIT